jgi:hypothetical protein
MQEAFGEACRRHRASHRGVAGERRCLAAGHCRWLECEEDSGCPRQRRVVRRSGEARAGAAAMEDLVISASAHRGGAAQRTSATSRSSSRTEPNNRS